ncbi:beta-glucosidase 34-like [Schistocerca piceifrons]|uniref:beta-glucosidase 34-like n=1 Tax=Schistocerca piceifrons TaxID=274613 RepID=UPI001F5EDF69|nr:beta-glucosidase 34-like [Schistocerca piceifrons]
MAPLSYLELLGISCLLAAINGSESRAFNEFPEGFLFGAATSAYQAKVYRFSISWSRIQPNGDIDVINQAGTDYYNNLIKLLLEIYIQPLVKMLLTFNERYDFTKGYATTGGHAPSQKAPGIVDYLAAHTVIRAHAMVYRLYDEQYRSTQNGKVGITLNCDWFVPYDDLEESLEAQERVIEFQLDLYANPIYIDGDYPAVVRERVDNNSRAEGRPRSRLPSFTDEEKRMINGSSDFFGLNSYTASLVKSADQYLAELLKAINEDRANVIGYTAWSLIDNLEWNSGFRPKFGIYHVDFNSTERTRTPMASVSFLHGIYSNMSVPEEYFT